MAKISIIAKHTTKDKSKKGTYKGNTHQMENQNFFIYTKARESKGDTLTHHDPSLKWIGGRV